MAKPKLTPQVPGEAVATAENTEAAEAANETTGEAAVESGLVLTAPDADADLLGEPRPDNHLSAEQQAEIYGAAAESSGDDDEVLTQGGEFSQTVTATGLTDEERAELEELRAFKSKAQAEKTQPASKPTKKAEGFEGAKLTKDGWVLKG